MVLEAERETEQNGNLSGFVLDKLLAVLRRGNKGQFGGVDCMLPVLEKASL